MKKLYLLIFMSCFYPGLLSAHEKIITGAAGTAENEPAARAVLLSDPGNMMFTETDWMNSINAGEASRPELSAEDMKTTGGITGSDVADNAKPVSDQPGQNDTVMTGYGIREKSLVTGSIVRVDGASLSSAPVSTVEMALQGRVAGVFIESLSGKAAGSARMRIRGATSVTAGNDPLFVVDGIPLATESLNQSGAAINPLLPFNINDIESVEILKDASAAAIYGSRGANGVVLITTKRGISGDTRLNFTLQRGFSQPSARRDFLNSEQYIRYFEEAAYNSDRYEGLDPLNNPADYSGSWLEFARSRFERYSGWAAYNDPKLAVNTDWQDQAFRTGSLLTADFSARGGNDNLKFYASASYTSRKGILISNGWERITGRLNLDNKVNRFLDIGVSLSLSGTNVDQIPADNSFSSPMQLVALAPITPVRDKEGKLYNTPTTTYYNSLIDTEDASRKISNLRTLANSYLNFKILENLVWKNEIGIDLLNLKENCSYGKRTESGEDTGGYGFANYGEIRNISPRSYIDYSGRSDNFGISGVLGTEYQYTVIDNAWLTGQDFPTDDLRTLSNAGFISGSSSERAEYSYLSWFSRINFDYRYKYIISLSARVDGSSRFGKKSRYGTFPAVSAGWVLSREGFLADVAELSFLKLRISTGLTGNTGIGNYSYIGLFGTDNYNGSSGLIPGQVPNENLKWESTLQTDFGLDFGLFENRISGGIDYYIKNTSDLIVNVPVPGTSGNRIQAQNLGSMRNEGFEFVLNTTNTAGALLWSTNVNFSVNRNRITDLGKISLIDEGSSVFMNVAMVDQPLGVFYGAEYAGADPADGDALWYVNPRDAQGNITDHTTTTSDYSKAGFVVLGNPNPPVLFAITNSLNYRNFELSFMFQGVSGNKIHLAGDSFLASNATWFDNQTTDQLKSWKKPGDQTDIPQARLGYINGNQSRSSRYVSPGDYIKLRTAMLSYDLPVSFLNKLGLSGARVYVQGHNLLTFSKYRGWDPEVSADFMVNSLRSGSDFYSAPQPRTVLAGISISL